MERIHRLKYMMISLLILATPFSVLGNETVQESLRSSEMLKEYAPGLLDAVEKINMRRAIDVIKSVPETWQNIADAVHEAFDDR